jgi:DNA-directed RNA polymerase subunit M/transcription elongation factor TFIIS
MHFCKVCSNMYYIKLSEDDENQLIYYCRNCGDEDTSISKNNVVVSTTNIKKTEQKFHHIINEYTKLDPTLPRISTIRCPNNGCISNKEDEKVDSEVIYMRYDDENMKYVYLCVHCDKVWLNNKHT